MVKAEISKDDIDKSNHIVGDIDYAYKHIVVKKGTKKIIGYETDGLGSYDGAVVSFGNKFVGYVWQDATYNYDDKKNKRFNKVYADINDDFDSKDGYKYSNYIGDLSGDISQVIFDDSNKDLLVNLQTIGSIIDGEFNDDFPGSQDRMINGISDKLTKLADGHNAFFSKPVVDAAVNIMKKVLTKQGSTAFEIMQKGLYLYDHIGLIDKKDLEIDKYGRMKIDDIIKLLVFYFLFSIVLIIVLVFIMIIFKKQQKNRQIDNIAPTAENVGEYHPDLRVKDPNLSGNNVNPNAEDYMRWLGLVDNNYEDNIDIMSSIPNERGSLLGSRFKDNNQYGDENYRNDNLGGLSSLKYMSGYTRDDNLNNKTKISTSNDSVSPVNTALNADPNTGKIDMKELREGVQSYKDNSELQILSASDDKPTGEQTSLNSNHDAVRATARPEATITMENGFKGINPDYPESGSTSGGLGANSGRPRYISQFISPVAGMLDDDYKNNDVNAIGLALEDIFGADDDIAQKFDLGNIAGDTTIQTSEPATALAKTVRGKLATDIYNQIFK